LAEKQPLVTIAIPTYNRADGYLRQAVESALAQTYPDIEILVSDNCSEDGTRELIEGLGEPRIHYVRHSRNIGANNNFNFCVQAAGGGYLLLLHDDDLIDPDFVESCMGAVEPAREYGIIRTGTRLIDGAGRELWAIPNRMGGLSNLEFYLGWFRHNTSHYLCSTMFNTRRLQQLGGFSSPRNLFQDVVAEFILAKHYGRLDIPDVKASFRRHEENFGSAATIMSWCEDSLYLLDLMCTLEKEHEQLIRAEGMRFFARKNYAQAYRMEGFSRRYSAMLKVYRSFEYSTSFLPFVLKKNVNRGREGARKVRDRLL
jgi:glycosyltransferase involved in cell wall biosynthesis